jgi:hypothetical protein
MNAAPIVRAACERLLWVSSSHLLPRKSLPRNRRLWDVKQTLKVGSCETNNLNVWSYRKQSFERQISQRSIRQQSAEAVSKRKMTRVGGNYDRHFAW